MTWEAADLDFLKHAASDAPGPSASPLPSVDIKPATVPRSGKSGIAPRVSYSKVNTQTPDGPDAGAEVQKNLPPRGIEMLPKIAGSEDSMTQIAVRPTVQDMIKAAMAGVVSHKAVALEAARQAENLGEKLASAAPTTEEIDAAEKLASALEFIADELVKEAKPGEGPGALHVMEAKASGKLPEHHGESSAHKVPMSTPEQKSTKAGPATQMQNTMEHPVPGTQQSAMVGQKGTKVAAAEEKCPKCGKEKDACTCSKTASAIRQAMAKMAGEKEEKQESEGMNEVAKGLAKAEAAHEKEKQAFSVTREGHKLDAAEYGAIRDAHEKIRDAKNEYKKDAPTRAEFLHGGHDFEHRMNARHFNYAAKKHEKGENAYNPFGGLLTKTDKEKKEKKASIAESIRAAKTKLAEDAINPAHISAGAAVPPDTRQGGEAGGVAPAGGQTSMIASNEAATNYTKGQAKAEPKSDMKAYVSEPAMGNDTTLRDVFTHAGEAGTKFASASVKTAAARALLKKLADEAATQAK